VSIEECGGRSLILSCDKKKARVWDADSGTQLRVLETWLSRIFGGSNLHAAAIGKLGDRTVVAPIRSSGAIRLWDAHTGKKIVKLPVKNASTIAFGRFGDSPIIVCGSSELQLFDGCSLRLIAKLAQTGLIKALAVEEIDGQQTIIFGNQENEIRLWDGVSGKPHLTIATAHSDSLTGITCGVINGRSVILSGSRDGTVRVWDLRNAQLLKTISLEQPVNAIQCDERGRVAAATDRGVLVLLLASFDGLTEVSVDDREEAKASVNG
jgi:WD40 repeat protein